MSEGLGVLKEVLLNAKLSHVKETSQNLGFHLTGRSRLTRADYAVIVALSLAEVLRERSIKLLYEHQLGGFFIADEDNFYRLTPLELSAELEKISLQMGVPRIEVLNVTYIENLLRQCRRDFNATSEEFRRIKTWLDSAETDR